jgi:hypothetical protein
MSKTSREIALEWWKSLGNKAKDETVRKAGMNRNYVTLTGREVEELYKGQFKKNEYTRDEVISLMDKLLIEFSDYVIMDEKPQEWVKTNLK